MGCGHFRSANSKNECKLPASVSTVNSFVRQNQQMIESVYEFEEKIGVGTFGQVIAAIHRLSLERRAVKIIPRKSLVLNSSSEKLVREIEILSRLDHPNIVRVYEYFFDEKCLYLVMERCLGGELLDEIVERRSFDERTAAYYMKQLLSAIAYCHSRNIVHRDLKPENLLLSSKSPDATLKVIDFGTSVFFSPHSKLKRKLGTVHYLAPEVLHNSYTEKCDIWSCGVILYILLSGRMPFPGSEDEAAAQIERGNYLIDTAEWDSISDSAKSLIRSMLQPDPKLRLSAEAAFAHPWVQQMSGPRLERNRARTLFDNLVAFRAEHKMQRAVLGFMASQLISSEEEQELTRLFRAVDRLGSGKISKDDLILVIKTSGYVFSPPLIDEILRYVDMDRNGFIDYTEFLIAASDKSKLLSKEKLESAFAAIDQDGNGRITSEELRGMLGAEERMPGSVWEELIRGVDQNGDGEVDLREFKEMMIKYV